MTFDEFVKIVRKNYDENLLAFSKERRDNYFNGEEAKEYIQHEYTRGTNRFKNGEITEKVLREGIAPTVGYCLSMMCD